MNSTQDVASLRPKNRVPTTILACVALAFWIRGGMVLGSNYDTSGAIPVIVAWLAGLTFLLFLLCWSVAGQTVVARHGDHLTVKSKIGNFGILGGKSVSLTDAKRMSVEARVYGYRQEGPEIRDCL
jgi:ABC-type long-subunit fatty acid transport system fused permease/ATPase subunit